MNYGLLHGEGRCDGLPVYAQKQIAWVQAGGLRRRTRLELALPRP